MTKFFESLALLPFNLSYMIEYRGRDPSKVNENMLGDQIESLSQQYNQTIEALKILEEYVLSHLKSRKEYTYEELKRCEKALVELRYYEAKYRHFKENGIGSGDADLQAYIYLFHRAAPNIIGEKKLRERQRKKQSKKSIGNVQKVLNGSSVPEHKFVDKNLKP